MSTDHPPAPVEPLAWENLGAQPAARAFGRSLVELLVRPRDFFGKMALDGGLHEPLTFFCVLLGAAIVLAFPAALAYLGVAAPDPSRVPAEVYARHLLPSQAAGLLLVLLPVVLALAGSAAVLLGTVFHVAGLAFGSRSWEGSVSAWLYACSAALAPVVAALALTLLVSLAGYLASIPWPGARAAAAQAAGWTAGLSLAAAGLAALGLLLTEVAVGCGRAFGLDPLVGAAAGVSGVLAVGVVLGACAWASVRHGLAGGLAAVGLCAFVACVATLALRRRAGGGA